jgi:TRAP transporter TAXI family solute receptor
MKSRKLRQPGNLFQSTAIILMATLLLSTPAMADKLTGLAGSMGGLWYRDMAGIAKAVKETFPDLQIDVVSGGGVGNLIRASKSPDVIGCTSFINLVQAGKGIAAFKGRKPIKNLRLLLSTMDVVYLYALFRQEVPITNVRDIKTKKLGLKINTIPKGTSTEWMVNTMLKYTDISYKDIESYGGKVSFTNWNDMVNLMKDGHIDGILGGGAEKAGWLINLTTARKINFTPFDEASGERFNKEWESSWGILPANTYQGQDKPYRTIRLNPFTVVVANESLPEETAYKIVKAVCDNPESFKLVHQAQLKHFTPAGAWKAGTLQLHKGAEKYFREKGYIK